MPKRTRTRRRGEKGTRRVGREHSCGVRNVDIVDANGNKGGDGLTGIKERTATLLSFYPLQEVGTGLVWIAPKGGR